MVKISRYVKWLTVGLALGATASPALSADSTENPLANPLAEIHGILRDSATGSGVAGARLTLFNMLDPSRPLQLPQVCFTMDHEPDATGAFVTGADGSYLFRLDRQIGDPFCPADPEDLPLRIQIQHPDYVALSPDSAALNWRHSKYGAHLPDPYVLRLRPSTPPSARISGVATDSQTGGAVPGAQITLLGPNGSPADASCLTSPGPQISAGASGAYSFDVAFDALLCPEGRYTIQARPPAALQALYPAEGANSGQVSAPSARIDVTLAPRSTAVSGRVLDASSNRPIPNAQPSLSGPNGAFDEACFAPGGAPGLTAADGSWSAVLRLGAEASCRPVGADPLQILVTPAPPTGSTTYLPSGAVSGNGNVSPGVAAVIDSLLTPETPASVTTTLRGVVVENYPGEAPIAGVQVVVMNRDDVPFDGSCFAPGGMPALTGDDGRWSASFILGSHVTCPREGATTLIAVIPIPPAEVSYNPPSRGTVYVGDGGTTDVPLRLTPSTVNIVSTTISGFVLKTSDRSPVGGVEVFLTGPRGERLDSRCFAPNGAPGSSDAVSGAWSAVVRLGAHASCPVTGTTPVRLSATPVPPSGSDYASASGAEIPGAIPGATITNVALTLTPRAPNLVSTTISGSIRESAPTRTPVSGAQAALSGPNGPLDSICFAPGGAPAATGVDGLWSAILQIGAHATCPPVAAAGSLSISATPVPPAGSDYQTPSAVTLNVVPGSDDANFALVLTPRAANAGEEKLEISGVIKRDGTEIVIPDAIVSIAGPRGPLAAACFVDGTVSPVYTDAAGRYAFSVALGADPTTCPSGADYVIRVEPPVGNGGYVAGENISMTTRVGVNGSISNVDLGLGFTLIDLQLAKTVLGQKTAFAPGEAVTYRLRVVNNGPAAEWLQLEDRPSPWLTLIEDSPRLSGDARIQQGSGQNARLVAAPARPTPISVPPGQPLKFDLYQLPAGGTLNLEYTMRIARTAGNLQAENTAVLHHIYPNGASLPIKAETARIDVVSGAHPFDDSVVYGKVFYDCNLNGWQDQPSASGLTLYGGFAPGEVIRGSVTVDRGFGPEAFAGDLSALALGDLAPQHVGAGSQAGRIVVRARLTRPSAAPLRLTSAEGFDAAFSPSGDWIRSSSPGFGGCEDLRLMRALTPAPDGAYDLTMVVVSGCRAERGVAGARLATVEGLVIETDQHGRYHIADSAAADWRRGNNMLVKLDEASLPFGSRLLSTNPQRLRLTGGPMQAANFAVSCPAPQGFYAQQTAEIGAVCFVPGTAALDPAQAGALVAAAEHLLMQGGGEVVVECRPCEGKLDETLNAGRVAAVHQALAGMLSVEVMSRVTVRSEVKGFPPAHGGLSPIPAGGPASLFTAPSLPHGSPHGLPHGLTIPPAGSGAPLPLPAPTPEPAPSKGFFNMIFGSSEPRSGAGLAGPFRVAALAGAILGAQEAKADSPGAAKPVAAPLVRGVAETPRPQMEPPRFVGSLAPAPICPTLGRPLSPGEICPQPAPIATDRYCPDTGVLVPLGSACPIPQPVQTAVPAPVFIPPPAPVEPPKPAFAIKPREICPEAKCADLSVRGLVELPFGASLVANADAQAVAPRLDAIAPAAALLNGGSLAEPLLFQSFSNYGPFIQRWEVALFRESDRSLARPIAVLEGARLGDPVLWRGEAADGRPLRPGETLRYVVRAYDAEGRRDQTKTRELLLTADAGHMALKRGARSAYGRDSLDRQSIPLFGGRVAVRGAGVPQGWLVAVAGEEVPVNQHGEFAWEGLRLPGDHEIPVELAAPDGVVWNRSVAAHVPADSFFMVGLADLTIGQDYVSKSLERLGPGDDFDEDVFANGRLAFYLKGKIQGRYLITAQADTHENEIKHIFRDFVDYRNPQNMFRRLDPDRYYPVYGDGSTSYSDVDTQGKFYVRVEDGDSSLIWGNYNTGLTGTELARYERTLYGARAEYVSRSATSYGEAHVQAKAFASQPQTAAAHNEFIGTGGSLYYLRQRDLVTGSEKLRVEVRDRDSGRVLESVALVPGKDYEINAIQGRVMLTNPLRSFAGRSGTNVISGGPLADDVVFLVADYEYVPEVGDTDSWTYGGRALAWLGDHLRLGGTYVEENQEGASAYELMGADAVLRWRPGTYLRGEWARSNSAEGARPLLSGDGGLTFLDAPASLGRPTEGDAFSIEARADLLDFFEGGGWTGEAQAWWRERDDGYSNVQTTLERFRRSFGGSVELKPNADLRLALRAFQGDHETGSRERVVAGQVDKEFGRVALSVEARYEEEINRGAPDASGLILGARVGYKVMDGAQVYVRGQTSVLEEGDFVDATGGALGFSARISDKLTAHAEYAYYVDRGNGATVGLEYQRNPDHVVYGTYTHSTDREDERRHAFSLGQRATVTSGLDVYQENLFGVRRDGGFESSQIYGAELSPLTDLTIGLSYQRSDLELGTGNVDRDAVSASARWKDARLELSGKAEYRRDQGAGEDSTQWLASVRAKGQLTDDLALLGKASVSHTDSGITPERDARFWEASVGLAYRPVEHDNLHLLARYSYVYDLPAPFQTANATDQKAHLLSAEGALRVTPSLSFGAKGAYKHGEIRDARNSGGWTKTRLSYGAVNARLQIFDNWDLMAEYRTLHDLETSSTRHGALLAVYRSFGDNFELGAGYNFAAFGDDLLDLDANGHGWFINAVGKF